MRRRRFFSRAVPPTGLPPRRRRLDPSQQRVYVTRNRTAEIITISILVAGFLLLGLGVMLWAIQTQTIALGPTPTPTATAQIMATATADFRATRVVEDFLTQQARQVAQSGTPLPTIPITPEPDIYLPALPQRGLSDPEEDDAENNIDGAEDSAEDGAGDAENDLYVPVPGGSGPDVTGTPAAAEETQNAIRLPILASEPLATPTAAAAQPAEATDTPTPADAIPVEPAVPTAEPPTETPTETPTATVEPPTATPTLPLPTPSPTLQATPSPPPDATQPVVVGSLRGYVRDQDTDVYIGPSILYTQTGTLAANAEVRMLGRTPSGEWVYVCCINNNEPAWVRHAYVKPRDNPLPPAVPTETNPNDIRFLTVQPAPSGLVHLPSPTPPPEGSFPMLRYDRAATGLLPALPTYPLQLAWPGTSQAGQPFVSPAIVGSEGVVAGSADNHLYSFDRVNGNQRWRYNVGQPIRMAPLIYDNEIFVADESGNVFAFEDHGNQAAVIWSSNYGRPAITSFNVYSETLFLGVGQGTEHTLLAIDRDNGTVLRQRDYTGPGLRYPVVGDQLVYAADSTLVALDVFRFDPIWERGDITQAELVNFQTAPVYGSPGVRAQAELYIVDGNNRVWCLDANTGDTIWSFDNGEAATSLALTPRSLIVAGNGYIKAIARDDTTERWRAPMVGTVLGGPLTDGDQVLVVTQGGNIQFFDADTGDTRSSAIPAPAGGAAAVGGQWLYIPGADSQFYAAHGSGP